MCKCQQWEEPAFQAAVPVGIESESVSRRPFSRKNECPWESGALGDGCWGKVGCKARLRPNRGSGCFSAD